MTIEQAQKIEQFVGKNGHKLGLIRTDIISSGSKDNYDLRIDVERGYHFHVSEFGEFTAFLAGIRFAQGGDLDRRID